MTVAESFFSAAKQLLLATENMKRLDEMVSRLADDVSGINLRLVRVETVVALRERPRRGKTLPGDH